MFYCPCCNKELSNQKTCVCPRCNLDLFVPSDENRAREEASDVIIKCEAISFFEMPGCVTLEELQNDEYIFSDHSKPTPQDNRKRKRRRMNQKKPFSKKIPKSILITVLLGWTGTHRKMIGDTDGARLFFIFGVIGGLFTCGVTTLIAEAIALYGLYRTLSESGIKSVGKSEPENEYSNDYQSESVESYKKS